MQDLTEESGRLEGCACSYGTSSMGLTSKTSVQIAGSDGR